jgi:nitroreductase
MRFGHFKKVCYNAARMTIHDMLRWRYATKKFDPEKELPSEDLEYILAAGNLAATSFGLQPVGVVVVTDPEKKAALQAAAYNQPHVGTNSALLVVCARTDVNEALVENFARRIERIRDLPEGAVAEYETVMKGALSGKTDEEKLTWAQKQAYIVLGTMMIVAAERAVDHCPMEGFDPAQFNDILGLDAHHLHATALLPLGYRSPEDETQHWAKVRKPLNEFVVRV